MVLGLVLLALGMPLLEAEKLRVTMTTAARQGARYLLACGRMSVQLLSPEM